MNRTKIIATSLIGVASLGIITAGTLALFTDFADAADEGIAGKLDINVHDFILSNKDNINPGDNDPLAPKTYVPLSGDPLYDPANPGAEVPIPTTDHLITYTISNDGNQSARVRRSLYVSCITPEGEVLDPSNFFIYEGDKELVDKYYVDSENKEYRVAVADPANQVDTVPENAKIVAVKYIENLDIYDGVGKGAQVEKESTVKEKDGVCSKSFEYHLGMAQNSPNTYQGVNVKVELVVEALQFRNTTDTKWTETSRNVLTATTSGLHFSVVPSAVPVPDQVPAQTTVESTAETTVGETTETEQVPAQTELSSDEPTSSTEEQETTVVSESTSDVTTNDTTSSAETTVSTDVT